MDFVQYGLSDTDIQFLQKKLDEGNLVTVTGSLATTGELVAITPPSGKTFYHVHSSIMNASTTSATNAIVAVVSVRNNGTTKDYLGGSEAQHNSYQASNLTGAKNDKTESKIPSSLVGDSAKKFTLNIDSISNCTIYGTIIGYYEDT